MGTREMEIDLWVLGLRPDDGDVGLLQEPERARLERLRVEEKRRQFLAAQIGLRRILARYLDTPAGEIRFAYGEHGKPRVPADPGLAFNLSHSGERAVVGVARDTDLGVDIEYTGRERSFSRLARRFFHPEEAAWLQDRAESARARGFYRLWTLKEAYLKATGTGLTVPTSSFRVDPASDPPRLLEPAPGDDVEDWRLAAPEPVADHATAICWCGGPAAVEIRHHHP